MIYYEYKLPNGEIIATNFERCRYLGDFIGKEKENIKLVNCRNLYTEGDFGAVRLVVDDEKYLSSSSLAKSLLEGRAETARWIIAVAKENSIKTAETLRLFAHNLTSVHAHLKQKVQKLYTEDVYKLGDYEKQKEVIREKLAKSPDRSADDYCQIAKRVDDLGAQIEGFKLLSGVAPKLDLGRHDFKRITLRFLQPFLSDLKSRNISVDFISGDNQFKKYKPLLDPRLISLALNHFFHNVVKYCASDSDIKVGITKKDAYIEIVFDMVSVQIEDGEEQRIFEKGYSGLHTGDKAGEGLGLYVVEKALEKFGARLHVPSCKDSGVVRIHNKVPYCANSFRFVFKE